MISVKKLIHYIDETRHRLGLQHRQLAQQAQLSEKIWREFRGGNRKPTFEDLARLTSVVGLSLRLVDKHHAPFMSLTPEEAQAVMRMVLHFKRNGPKMPIAFQSAANKIEAELNVPA